MGIVLNKYKNMLLEFINKEKLFLFLITITCAASYGFTITNFSIGIDDTSVERYIHGGELLSQGRFGAVILDKIFGVMTVLPFWTDFLAVLILVFAAIIWSILFKSVAKDKIKSGALIIFATIFVSYPLINEIFIYMPASLSICAGYLLTGIALILSYEFVLSKKISLGVISTLLMCFVVSIYESFAAVYICGFFAILIIKYIFQDEEREGLKKYFLYIFKFCLILLIAILLNLIISNILIKVIGLTRSDNGEKSILWLNKGSIQDVIGNLIEGLKNNFGYMSTWYRPILVFLVTCIFTVVLAFVLAIRFKSITPAILMLGLGISNILLSLVQGAASPYRTCQSFAIFIGVVWMLLAVLIDGRYKKVILYALVFILVLYQTRDLSQWFYNDYKRFEIDRTNIIHIAQTIEGNYGRNIQKPIVFIGNPGQYQNINRNQTNGQSFLCWSIEAFDENSTELLKFMRIYGYNFAQPTNKQVSDAKLKSKGMPSWPMKGYISEFSDYIVVNFG